MLSPAAVRAAPRTTTTSVVARRGFHATRAQLSSPYHYPEGPRTNIPFNPLTKFFFLRYWGSMALFFGAPFGIAGMYSHAAFGVSGETSTFQMSLANVHHFLSSLANLQAQISLMLFGPSGMGL